MLNNKTEVVLLEDGLGMLNLKGLTEIYIKDFDQMMTQIITADNNRNTQKTILNDVSSRSHSVCEIHLRNTKFNLKRKIVIIDLAGSERSKSSIDNEKIRKHEGAEINKSLL